MTAVYTRIRKKIIKIIKKTEVLNGLQRLNDMLINKMAVIGKDGYDVIANRSGNSTGTE